MSHTVIINRLSKLPEHLQQEVYDFIEFLTMKYLEDGTGEDFDDNEELSDELKAFLDKRIASMRANPEDNSTWEEVKERLYNKMGWKE